MLYFMFDATKVRKTSEKHIRNLHIFLSQIVQTFARPHSVETIN